MNLFLEPVDVWLFRDGRPFDALSDHRAASLFPPYPTVLQGAIRSHHLAVLGVDLRDPQAVADAVGTAEDVRNLRLRGPFLARRERGGIDRYLPQPTDAVLVDPETPKIKAASRPEEIPSTSLTSAPTPCLLGLGDLPTKGREDLWLHENELHAYLRGDTVPAVPGQDLFVREVRSGIALDSARRTAQESALYEVEFVRPCDGVGLLIEVEGYEGWPSEGLMRLGGEGKEAWFEQVTPTPWPVPPGLLPERFKLCFATPAYFANGWIPKSGDWSPYFEGETELVAAAVGRYASVGGFDLAANGPKPARRFVPTGSVYYFQCSGQTRLKPDLVQQALSDWGAEIGFGQIAIEEW